MHSKSEHSILPSPRVYHTFLYISLSVTLSPFRMPYTFLTSPCVLHAAAYPCLYNYCKALQRKAQILEPLIM
jgi:hypothetical protein